MRLLLIYVVDENFLLEVQQDENLMLETHTARYPLPGWLASEVFPETEGFEASEHAPK